MGVASLNIRNMDKRLFDILQEFKTKGSDETLKLLEELNKANKDSYQLCDAIEIACRMIQNNKYIFQSDKSDLSADKERIEFWHKLHSDIASHLAFV